MWVASTDEEANFIFDIQADRDDPRSVLEYACWLEDRDPLRAEFLRLDLSPDENKERLSELRPLLDVRWLNAITARRFRPGDVVRITGGVYSRLEGTIHRVDAAGGRADVYLHMFCRPTGPIWVAFSDLQILKRAPEAAGPTH